MQTFGDMLRQLRAGVGRDTIDQLTVITEQLCCEYVSRRPEDLREDAHHQLEYVQRLLERPTRLSEHRDRRAWSLPDPVGLVTLGDSLFNLISACALLLDAGQQTV